MGKSTNIEWTRSDDGSPGNTWNPADGCSRASEGCRNCFIERQTPFRVAHRRFNGPQIGATTGVQLHPNRLMAPLRWRMPSRVFVCSMADLFHAEIPGEYIAQIFAVMALARQHTFQVLTKRHGRMRSLLRNSGFQQQVYEAWGRLETPKGRPAKEDWPSPEWPLPNVWLGVSTEDQKHADLRIPALFDTPAAVRFVSAEPLLGPLDIGDYVTYGGCGDCDCDHGCQGIGANLDWVIVGGESGPGSRPMHPDWARSLRDQCVTAEVPFFFKQWGDWVPESLSLHRDTAPAAFLSADGRTRLLVDGKPVEPPMAPNGDITIRKVGKKRGGRVLDRRIWEQFPVAPGIETSVGVRGRQ